VQASLGEVAHARDEQQVKADKLQEQMLEVQQELEAAQEDSGRLMADLSEARVSTPCMHLYVRSCMSGVVCQELYVRSCPRATTIPHLFFRFLSPFSTYSSHPS